MKKILIIFLSLFVLISCSINSKYINVKYRDSKVNIADSRWEYLNTSESSFVNGAWYDGEENYMIIKLNSTYYHYCDIPRSIWNDFKVAESFGSYYNYSIKGNYDCRINHVPNY